MCAVCEKILSTDSYLWKKHLNCKQSSIISNITDFYFVQKSNVFSFMIVQHFYFDSRHPIRNFAKYMKFDTKLMNSMVYWWHLVWLWVGKFSLNWKQKSSIERYPIKLCMNMNEKTEKEKWKKALVDLRRYKIVYRFAFIIIATNKIYSESFDIWPLFDRKHFVCFFIFEKSNRPNTV